ncbi:glycosyltransferase family 4 protein [Geomonas sp. Red32]|uniref:glycosyltransferase family 4 protein n=1 Tax=Geomonas sp. Red32 TaxID=2912856 RepID=UPI00202CE344|nr:glycosyltransferase family 4 protein [Geomonas sp. Red32]MCM0081378.1 glycosyltransferase family 4 protein [Geomonas sp. Red32]
MNKSLPHVMIAIPLLQVGGTEMQTLHQVRALVTGGFRVSVCCFYEHHPSMVAAMEEAGARVILMGLDRAQGYGHLLGRLRTLFREEQPRAVHVQYISPGLIPILAARLALVPFVFATVHQPGRTYGAKPHLLLRFAAALCDTFFCNSLSVERSWFGTASLFTAGQSRLKGHCTIYNAVDVETIARTSAQAPASAIKGELGVGDVPVIAVVGRLRWEKGQGVAIAALAEVAREYPTATLLMIGEGPDREALERQAQELGVANRIVWRGRLDSGQLFRLLGGVDLLVVPSLFEGFGLAAAEGMAAGLPVVASGVDGLAEVVEDGETGLLVPPNDSRALAGAIASLLADPARRLQMGERALSRVGSFFSLERYNQQTLAFYGRVADGQ